MSETLQPVVDLTNAAARRDKLAAWEAAGRVNGWLSDLRNTISDEMLRNLVWSGASFNRWFDLAEVIAAAAAQRADATPGMRRLHAQMLMERGFIEEALWRLEALLAGGGLTRYDYSQTLGHLGRIHKERFIAEWAGADEARARDSIEQGIRAYLEGYETDHASLWHGVNALALLAHPLAASVRPSATELARRIARELLDELPRQPHNAYRDAIAAEAYLALGDFGQAAAAIWRYTADPNVRGFAYATFRRQLSQVWSLDRRSSPGPELVAMVSAALVERESGVLDISGAEVQRARNVSNADLQAVFGADRFDSYDNYRRGLDRCSSVARIGRSVETGAGTGFVIPGKALCAKLGDPFVLVTNAHVVSEDERLRNKGALHPQEAIVTFAALEGCAPDAEFALGKVLMSSPPEELDVTIAELSEPVVPKAAYPLAPVLPARESESQIRVIGHPSGRGLSISANKLLDHEDPKIHYRTATEGGSSGSPVFNQDWRLIGLHHAGGEMMPKLNGKDGTYEANEGIWIKAICKALDSA